MRLQDGRHGKAWGVLTWRGATSARGATFMMRYCPLDRRYVYYMRQKLLFVHVQDSSPSEQSLSMARLRRC